MEAVKAITRAVVLQSCLMLVLATLPAGVATAAEARDTQPSRAARKALEAEAWLRSLPGRYRLSGIIRAQQFYAAADSWTITDIVGTIECTHVGDDPWVRCIANVRNKSEPERGQGLQDDAGEDGPDPVYTVDPLPYMFDIGPSPDGPQLRLLLFETLASIREGAGTVSGSKMTARVPCRDRAVILLTDSDGLPCEDAVTISTPTQRDLVRMSLEIHGYREPTTIQLELRRTDEAAGAAGDGDQAPSPPDEEDPARIRRSRPR